SSDVDRSGRDGSQIPLAPPCSRPRNGRSLRYNARVPSARPGTPGSPTWAPAHVFSCEDTPVPTRHAATDIRDLVVPIVDALACRLYDVEVTGAGKSRTVRVLIDREGGIDLDTVTEATRAISDAIDGEPNIGGPFLLEVSSPGLERPLRLPEHYAGAVGETVS